MLKDWIQKDRSDFEHRKAEIDNALAGGTGMIAGVKEKNKEKIFYELCFCLCVPQSRASLALEAIQSLQDADLYNRELSELQIVNRIKGKVRFQNVKARRIKQARAAFSQVWKTLQETYSYYTATQSNERYLVLDDTRSYLIHRIPGMGMKLASQFLRNIGMRGLSILDVHILGHLVERELIEPISSLTKWQYCYIEEIMLQYADQLGISIDELDLLWWSNKTGFVLK